MTGCTSPGCERPARAAVRTTRPKRDDLRVLLYADDRTAPKTAQRYCHEHTAQLMADLVTALVDVDDPPDIVPDPPDDPLPTGAICPACGVYVRGGLDPAVMSQHDCEGEEG